MKFLRLVFLFCGLIHFGAQAQTVQSLAGEWQFRLDAEQTLSSIRLPGTTDENGYGEKSEGADFGYPTRAFKYVGKAWYQRTIDIPQQWKGKRVALNLERVLWESRFFLDGKEISVQDALSVPHCHDLGYLSPGKHELRICVNNDLIYNIGDKGHAYTEHTQSIWNGIVGRIELVAREAVRFSNPQVYTSVSPNSLEVKDTIVNETGKAGNVEITLCLSEKETGITVYSQTIKQNLAKGMNPFRFAASSIEGIAAWDDVNPNLYTLEISVKDKEITDSRTVDVGFRQVSTSASKVLINGKPVFLRGNLDCLQFPLTGYPSCRVEDWERIFRIYKDYGLNHVRFHTWCPPEAAFVAADRTGLYLQVEVLWIDGWMAKPPANRPDMITKGSPEGLGKNPSADAFTQQELSRILNVYGNHPSFIMLCIGNELGTSDFDVMSSWVKPLKEQDNRRLFSLSTARKVTPTDQFMVTHALPGKGNVRGLRGGASTDWDFEDVYSQSDIPVIAHEIGQWSVYPHWEQIKKYSGVLKARNLEELQMKARENKIEEQNELFVAASGALNQLMYKYEIESFLRTPSCAGFQLLSIQDYPGQGEALVGWLDPFYDSKGITTPEKFRCHTDTTVALLRTPKFVWKNSENFTARVQLAHYGTQPLNDGLYWKIRDERYNLVAAGEIAPKIFSAGSSEIVGEINCQLSGVTRAEKLTVEVGLQNHIAKNRWNIWVYPVSSQPVQGDVYVTDKLDETCLRNLENGGKILLSAHALGTEKRRTKSVFIPYTGRFLFSPVRAKIQSGCLCRIDIRFSGIFQRISIATGNGKAFTKAPARFTSTIFRKVINPLHSPLTTSIETINWRQFLS
jgi:hypothetical protein